MSEMLDQAIIAKAATGEPQAFRQVVETYQSLVYNLAYRYVYNRAQAEDLAQECFLRLFQKFGQYDQTRPFRPWFLRLVSNTCLNGVRQEKRHRPLRAGMDVEEDGWQAKASACVDDPSQLAQSAEVREVVRQTVATLPPEYRGVIALRYFEGLEVAEIASTLEMPVGTVKIRLFRARDVLRRKLGSLADAWTG